MHNFSTTNAGAEPTLSNNTTIIEGALNNEIYHHWVDATGLEDISDAASPTYRAGSIATGMPAHWRMADGVVSGVGFYVPRHGEWRDGVLSVVPHYSCTATGNSLMWKVSVVAITNLTVATVTSVSQAKDAPSVVDAITTVDLSSSTLTPTSQINTGHIGVFVTVGRAGSSGSDTNTGVLYLYGVDLVYKESRRVVGGR